MWGVTTGTWVLAGIVALYVGLGGLRSVAYVDTLQCVLLWFGIVAIGFIAYDLVGGWDALNEGLAKVALVEGTKWGRTPGDNYSAYFAIPGRHTVYRWIRKRNSSWWIVDRSDGVNLYVCAYGHTFFTSIFNVGVFKQRP